MGTQSSFVIYREFQKHEALTVEKLEKALSQIQNESGVKETESNFSKELDIQMDLETDKENLKKNVTVFHPAPENDEMEITTSVVSTIQHLTVLQKTIVQTVEMDVSTSSLPEAQILDSPDLNQTAQNAEQFANISKDMEMSMQEIVTVEMKDQTVCASPITDFPLPENKTISVVNKEMEISYQEIEIIKKDEEVVCSTSHIHFQSSENEIKEIQMTVDEVTTVTDHTSLVNQKNVHYDISTKNVECAPINDPKSNSKVIIPDYYDESSEFSRVSKAYGWCVTRSENELSMQKLCNSFSMKFILGNEYLNQNCRHFVIEEIEVDTMKGLNNHFKTNQ